MDKIASFEVDHTKFGVGMYISRIDGDITTYDVRMVKPNGGNYLENGAMHTVEHLFATYARNSHIEKDIIYVGPMGCRTGFYLLIRNSKGSEAIELVREAFAFVQNYNGDIPGVSEIECGNYKEHNLEGAKRIVEDILSKLNGYTEEMLAYTWHFN